MSQSESSKNAGNAKKPGRPRGAEETETLHVRVPKQVVRDLKKWADFNTRTLSQEVIHRLKVSLRGVQ